MSSAFLAICSASCWLCLVQAVNVSRERLWRLRRIVDQRTEHHMLTVDDERNEPRRCTARAVLLMSTSFTACTTNSTSSAMLQTLLTQSWYARSNPSRDWKSCALADILIRITI